MARTRLVDDDRDDGEMGEHEATSTWLESLARVDRRAFLFGAAAAASALAGVNGAGTAVAAPERWSRWLGPEWWANRFQDWVRRGTRLECVAPQGQRMGRTVAHLTSEITGTYADLTVRTGTLRAGPGFSGFLVGTGVAGDDWRVRMLVGSSSGTGGGLLAVFESDGTVRFREHTDDAHPRAYAELASSRRSVGARRDSREDVLLRLRIRPDGDGRVRLELRASDRRTGRLLGLARRDGVKRAAVTGGVGLISSAAAGSQARYWFSGCHLRGPGVRHFVDRGVGPVVGTLFSTSAGLLKMTAQLMPVDLTRTPFVRLQVLREGLWATVATEPVGPGWTAAFRLPWDTGRSTRYRVVAAGWPASPYHGTIPREPTGRPLVVASVNCTKATHWRTDGPAIGPPRLPGESFLGRYSQRNVYFPFREVVDAVGAHQPDLLVAHGDQYYQNSPTEALDSDNPELDALGKYLLWLLAFRSLTRSTPTVVLVDDHDVYQTNLWGAGGVPATRGVINGGYQMSATWVNTMQRIQCQHDPDPFDPTPVAQGITVYFGSFSFGGVSFAVLEDRKFKSAPGGPGPDSERDLLGDRQELFLETWPTQHPGQPKIVLSQTTFACLQTDLEGAPMVDRDSGGWPQGGRDRALTLIAAAGGLVLSGDQHTGSLVRHERPDDPPGGPFTGPYQFTVPAAGSSFQRWFEPGPLPGSHGQPNTGRWVDAFGHELDVLAVVQPRVSRAAFSAEYPGSDLGDRNLKREGYGIARIDPAARTVVLECWPWNVDPAREGAAQYPGFPVELSVDDL